MGKYNDPEYWKNLANEERSTTSNYIHEVDNGKWVMEPCECEAPPTVTQLAEDLNQNLLEMKEVIDSISKYIFAEENEGLPSNGTIESLYGILSFDREVSKNLVKCLKIIRDKLG